MERERLTRVLKEPGQVAREDLVGLKAMTERYPWFSGAHLLLAAGEHAHGDVLHAATMTAAAAHIPSREALFDLAEAGAPLASVAVEVPPAPVPPPAEAVTPPAVEAEEVPRGPEPPTVAAPATSATDTAEPPLTAPQKEDVLDQQVVQAARSAAYDLLLHEQGPSQDIPPAAPPTVEARPEIILPPPPPPVQEPPRPGISASSRLRFTDWLSSAEPVAERIPTPAEPAPSEAAPQTVELPVTTAPVAVDTSALIDRFIQQDAPPPVAKAEFYTPQQAAKRSLDDSAGMVTETLARIYEKQGNLPKAIEAYARLALKHPQKSAYFAALQKALEEQLNK